MRLSLASVRLTRAAEYVRRAPWQFASEENGADDPSDAARSLHGAQPGEDLPYKVELWDAAKSTVEQVLAVTANGSIGYAAYYAATREYPARYITLRHKNSIVSRWNGPTN
jgi:hypothetical protein